MGVLAVTGAASGIGAASVARLTAGGDRVITVDVRDADVVADLGTRDGRAAAIAGIADRADGALDGLVTCAGLGPLPGRPGPTILAVDHFGTVRPPHGLRPPV